MSLMRQADKEGGNEEEGHNDTTSKGTEGVQ